MLTYSRGGAIVLAVVLLLILIEHIRKFKVKHLGFVTALLLIAIIMIIFFVPSSYWERQKSITETKTDTAMGRRISYLYFGWEAFKEHPIIGSGPGTFSKIYATSIYARHFAIGEEDYYRDAHNSYLEVVVETGAISFVIFLIIIWFSLKNFNNAKILFLSHGEKEMAALVGAYRTSFLSMLIYFFMLSTTYNKYFWFSLALSQIALRFAQKIPGGEYNENATYSK